MPELHLFNTLTRKKEGFAPADPGRVTVYLCGPTVYNYVHIGNAVGPVAVDVLVRLLRHLYGPKAVVYARNITDIDDKIIAAAAEERVAIDAITTKYAVAYREQMAALGVAAPDIEPAATGHIPSMIALIERLIAKGAAYVGASGVWFSVKADADYGKLSGRVVEDLRAGARVEAEADKRAPEDFALWKRAKPGEPAWDAPFGAGRPGWHIECSAMIAAELGETIDIHAGGQDLIFPHHENEIAQSETACGAPLARFWMHNGMLTMDSEKMSKSLGNVVRLNQLLEAWPGEVVRFALMSAHYRTPPNWTDDLLAQSKASLDRFYQALLDAEEIVARVQSEKHLRVDDNDSAHFEAQIGAPVVEALKDDLNTPVAIRALFAMSDSLRAMLIAHRQRSGDPRNIVRQRNAIKAAGALMGVLQSDPKTWFRQGEGPISDADVEAMIADRLAARKAKNFAAADRIRDELDALGIVVMDNPNGSTWRRT